MVETDLFRQIVTLDEIGYTIRTRLAAALMADKLDLSEELDVSTVIGDLNRLSEAVDMDHARFRRLLLRYVSQTANRIVAGTSQPRKPKSQRQPALMALLAAARRHIEAEIGALPGGPKKATAYLTALVQGHMFGYTDQIYDAMIYLGKEAGSLVAPVTVRWRQEQEHHRKSGRTELNEHLFWVSLDFQELFDAVSRYRFAESFGVGGFEAAMEQGESVVATPILERCSDAFEPGSRPWRSGDTFGIAFELWMLSRSPMLVAQLQAVIAVAVEWLANMQDTSGCWLRPAEPADGAKGTRFLPSATSTALSTLALEKLAGSDAGIAAGERGVRWLADNQAVDGTWRGFGGEALFPTTIALEALLRARRLDLAPSIGMGFDSLAGSQQAIGLWEDGRLPFPMQTVLVLELMRSRVDLGKPLEPFERTAVGFLKRARALRFSGGPTDRQLAVIAGAQGAEYLLYALLEAIGVDPFRAGSSSETKGLKAALADLEGHLTSIGELMPGKMATNGSALRQLSNLRDQVSHKALDVSAAELRLIDKAWIFASQYSRAVLHRDLLV